MYSVIEDTAGSEWEERLLAAAYLRNERFSIGSLPDPLVKRFNAALEKLEFLPRSWLSNIAKNILIKECPDVSTS